VKNTQEEIITDEYEGYTPIALVLQLISKLRNHKDIENVENENDLLQIIEGDEELNSIYEQLSVEDCGCEDDNPDLEWEFTIICKLLFPVMVLAGSLYILLDYELFYYFMLTIGMILNCYWV